MIGILPLFEQRTAAGYGDCPLADARLGEQRGGRLADEFVIFDVAPNPKPQQTVRRFHSDGTVVASDAHRPEPANLLEMQGWMSWVRFKQCKRSVGELL